VGLQGGYLSLLLTYHVQETVLSRVSSVYVVRMPCSIRLGPPAHTPAPGAALPDWAFARGAGSVADPCYGLRKGFSASRRELARKGR
jgi:hypothetical protein